MAFDGNGNWISDFSAVADRDANIKILASRFDNIFIADIASSFENCLTKDTQVKPTTNFNANNYRVINVADPVNDKDAVNKETLDSTANSVASSVADSKIDTLLSTLYPVGSIYIGTQSTCPLATLISGSTWTKIEGRYLLASGTLNGTSESYSATNTASAGLPNITGQMSRVQMRGADESWSGALYRKSYESSSYGGSAGNHNITLGIDASKSNAIYGSSNTVRPPAYAVNVWRRTA